MIIDLFLGAAVAAVIAYPFFVDFFAPRCCDCGRLVGEVGICETRGCMYYRRRVYPQRYAGKLRPPLTKRQRRVIEWAIILPVALFSLLYVYRQGYLSEDPRPEYWVAPVDGFRSCPAGYTDPEFWADSDVRCTRADLASPSTATQP